MLDSSTFVLDKMEHWLVEILTRTPHAIYWRAKINLIKSFIDNVVLLEDPHPIVASLADLVQMTCHRFYIVIDRYGNIFVLRYNPIDVSFSTFGDEPSLMVKITTLDIAYISQFPLPVTDEEMYNRYDKQLIQVYHSTPRQIIQDETDPLIASITKSLQELHQPWHINSTSQ